MRNPIALIWVLGAAVTLLAYQLGPNHLLVTLAAFTEQAVDAVQQWAYDLSRTAAEFMRAAAIGLYVVFAALSVLVIRQGGRAKTALILVSAVFYLLVWSDAFTASNNRGFAACALAGIGALVMTRRLTGHGRSIAPGP